LNSGRDDEEAEEEEEEEVELDPERWGPECEVCSDATSDNNSRNLSKARVRIQTVDNASSVQPDNDLAGLL
jgi:hypothetical protein